MNGKLTKTGKYFYRIFVGSYIAKEKKMCYNIICRFSAPDL